MLRTANPNFRKRVTYDYGLPQIQTDQVSSILSKIASSFLGFILNHTTSLGVRALKNRGKTIRSNPTKQALRGRFEDLLQQGEFHDHDLVNILTELEGWGHQQIYLLRCTTKPKRLSESWLKRNWVRKHLKGKNPSLLLDQRNPIAQPEELKLIAVYYSNESEPP